LVYDPYQKEQVFSAHNAASVELDSLLKEADLVSIHVPLNENTQNLLGDRELRLLKPEAILVNTARAAVVDQKALIQAVEEKWIAGVALDVHYEEPPEVGDPILRLPNILCTPHIGGATWEVITYGSELITADLDRILKGMQPENAAVLPVQARLFEGG
jgi:phosphoglycerate dehydrogenase-like enzyme